MSKTPRYDIDDPQNADLIIAAMKVFMAKNSVNGCLKFADNGLNYNLAPIPQRFRKPEEPPVIVQFKSVEHFKDVHKAASEFEDRVEREEITAFNKEKISFNAWPIITTPASEEVTTWVFLVEPKQCIESRVPNVGESCQIRTVDPETGRDTSCFWTARRIVNNFAAAGNSKASWAKLLAFDLHLSKNDELSAKPALKALISDNCKGQEQLDQLVLSDENAINVGISFTVSDATFTAEMAALAKLVKAVGSPLANKHELNEAMQKLTMIERWLEIPSQFRRPRAPMSQADLSVPNPEAVQPKQVAAFQYLIDFHDPRFSVNIFAKFPHMIAPMAETEIPSSILAKYKRLNEHQRLAYHGLLADMPCGMAFLPGGPGGGKTDWAMTVIGLMQSKSSAKVLYMLDINDPLDDATAKYIGMMKHAKLPKNAIRMRNFGTELKKSSRVVAVQKQAQCAARASGSLVTQKEMEDEPDVDFSKNFIALYTKHASGMSIELAKTRHFSILPTLDEAAWDYYESVKANMTELTELLESNISPTESRTMRRLIYQLYKWVLQKADFIATTPCVAASAFNKMFKPDLIVFDEAAHARELSTLIAIANFCPTLGWVFIGDHRQTQPTVKSNKTNPHGRQLATSTMERAHLAGVLKHQLLINHRAYGRLERLPSKLIYDGKMISGIPFKDRFPHHVRFVKTYFESLSGMPCNVPRLVVHLAKAGMPTKVGTSWYHPEHMAWTMVRVLDLLKSKHFRNAENPANEGTILLLAPYKAAVKKYQEAIEMLAKNHPHLRVAHRVEARTWDSSQGHEADIVGIDYVRNHCTDFMDGMYRFNVGLTRARQGEWHLMHPSMPNSRSFRDTKYLQKLYYACKSNLNGMGEGRVMTLDLHQPAGQLENPVPAKSSTPRPTVVAQAVATRPVNMRQAFAEINGNTSKGALAEVDGSCGKDAFIEIDENAGKSALAEMDINGGKREEESMKSGNDVGMKVDARIATVEDYEASVVSSEDWPTMD